MADSDTTRPPESPGPTADGAHGQYGKVRLTLAADNSAAIVFIGSGAPPESVSVMALTALVEERGLAKTAELTEALSAVAGAYAAAPNVDFEQTIAHGTPPVHGVDGRLELDERFDPAHRAAPAQPQPDAPAPTGRVDHHSRSAIVSVRRGDVIGHLLPPIIGREGIDVFGRALNPRDARPLKLISDETVLVAPDGTITAVADGMLVHQGNTLRISPKLTVPEYVDFSTGNVDFPGDVVINRGVRDCFSVHSGRTLLVRGLVEAAELVCELDMMLEGGMAGRQKGTLRSKRDASALYLEQVNGRIGRDLNIGKEATHSHLSVGRAIVAPSAALIGGDICVAGHAEVAQLGSDASAATKLAIGHLPEVDGKLRATSDLLHRVQAKRDAAAETLKQLQHASGKLTAQQAEELTEREFELSNLDQQIAKLKAAIGSLLTVLETAGESSLTVHADIWPGVKLWIGDYLCEPRQAIRGPLKVILSAHGEPQLVLKTSGATSSLSTVCRVMHDVRFVSRTAMYSLSGHKPVQSFSDESSRPLAA